MPLTERMAAARRGRVGSSEIAALPLINAHEYMTPGDVWDRVVLGTEVQENEAMRIGSYLEPHVLRMLRWQGLQSRACWLPYVHPDLPLSASPDAYSMPHKGYGRGLVEVKVTASAWGAELPTRVYWQVQGQLLLTGRPVCWVATLRGSRLDVSAVEPDLDAGVHIERAVAQFWDSYVLPRKRPDPIPFTFRS